MIFKQSKVILEKLNEKVVAPPVLSPKVETHLQSSFTEVLNEQKEIEDKLDVIVLSRTQLTSPTPFHTDTHMQKDQPIHIKTNIALS